MRKRFVGPLLLALFVLAPPGLNKSSGMGLKPPAIRPTSMAIASMVAPKWVHKPTH